MCQKLNYNLETNMQSQRIYVSLSHDHKFLYMETREENLAMKEPRKLEIAKIQSFLYGGQSSRFWMLRKLINQMGGGSEELPFYAWQCITLQQQVHDVDLIIED